MIQQYDHQYVMLDSTNMIPHPQVHSLSIPSEDVPSKRKPPTPSTDEASGAKRLRLSHSKGEADDDNIEGLTLIEKHGYHRTMYSFLQTSAWRPPSSFPQIKLPSHLILQSFVSSHRSDVWKCTSIADNTFASPPYACAYSCGAKSSGTPLLAVATEEGSVSILDTSKRCEWDFEPQRTVFQPHNNGIFDVKWSLDDRMLATASGDKSTRISFVERQDIFQMLQTHTCSVKCSAWDPNHRDVLSTGSRDGQICVWDLRMAGRTAAEGISVLQPVIIIQSAHGRGKPNGGRKKIAPLPRSVTSILYADTRPYALVSSGAFDGVLNLWDLRFPAQDDSTRQVSTPCASSLGDATTMNGSCRPRGISSLCAGSGPTSGLIFALGADSRLYTFSSPSLTPLGAEANPNLRTSFYVRLAGSPCGRWLASGCSRKSGSSFICDVSNITRFSASSYSRQPLATAVELRGQTGEVGAVDWAHNMLATCADDGTVRVWRPNYDVYQNCLSDPEAEKWKWSWSLESYPLQR